MAKRVGINQYECKALLCLGSYDYNWWWLLNDAFFVIIWIVRYSKSGAVIDIVRPSAIVLRAAV